MKQRKTWAAAITLLVIAAVFLLFIWKPVFFPEKHYLVLRNGHTQEEYARYPFSPDDTFAVKFIHSVNKTPVIDCYELRDGVIAVVKTIYYDFGAGVQTELNEGEVLSYGEDGSMIISNINKKIDPLLYFVGTVSDHTLILHDEEISLRDLCQRNALVQFSYE